MIQNIIKLVELLSSLFKKNFSGEYYKNIKSIFYFNNYTQTESTLNKLEKHPILKELQVQCVESDNSQLISTQSKLFSQNIDKVSSKPEVFLEEEKKIESMVSKLNTEDSRYPSVSAEPPVQKLELSEEGKLLKINSSYKDIKPIIPYDAKKMEKTGTDKQPKKLSNNPKFLEFKQELENRLKTSLESNSKNEEQKEKQACREDVLPLISNSENISTLSVELEIKPVVFSGNMPPPPPIEGLANFKGPKLPLSLPIQEQSRIKQEEFCNVSQSKVNIMPNVNNAFVDELTLKLEQRKNI